MQLVNKYLRTPQDNPRARGGRLQTNLFILRWFLITWFTQFNIKHYYTYYLLLLSFRIVNNSKRSGGLSGKCNTKLYAFWLIVLYRHIKIIQKFTLLDEIILRL